jgi:hypothetical protein
VARSLVAPGLGSFHKWDKIGSELKGRYMGQSVAKFGPVVVIDTSDGAQKKASMPGDLSDWMAQVQSGEYVTITFVESVQGKQPQPFKKFRVVIDDAPLAPAPGVKAPTTAPAPVGPSPAELAAARATLSAIGQTGQTEYDRLFALLVASNPKGAAAIKGALESFPEAERLERLKGVLTQQGVKVDG